MNEIYFLFVISGSGRTHLQKHDDDDRGCSIKKVDFESNILYELGECGASGLEKVHGTVFV